MSEFVPFDENLKEILADFLRGSGYVGSDYSYYAFICWFEKGEYRVTDDVLYLRAYVDDGVYYWPPLVKAGSSVTVEEAVLALPDDACFAFCTDKFVADTYGGYYVYTHRDWAEYIYKAGDFISLSGKRYHAKRNHIARFESSYKVSFDALCEGDLDDVARFESDWLAAREFDDKAEESAGRYWKTLARLRQAIALETDMDKIDRLNAAYGRTRDIYFKRRAQVMKARKGMTQKEISELLGLPRSTISNDICRMKEMLKAIDTRT